MKKYLAIIFTVLTTMAASAAAADGKTLVSLLSTNVGLWHDEIFGFKWTYSDVSWGKDGLKFTGTMLLEEEEGSIKSTAKCTLPLDQLKKAKIQLLINQGIGHNNSVSIEMPETASDSPVKVTTVTTKKQPGKPPVTTEEQKTGRAVNIHFFDTATATAWHAELSKLLK